MFPPRTDCNSCGFRVGTMDGISMGDPLISTPMEYSVAVSPRGVANSPKNPLPFTPDPSCRSSAPSDPSPKELGRNPVGDDNICCLNICDSIPLLLSAI